MADITPNTPNPVREDAYVTELATKLGIDAKYIPKSPTWRNEEEIKVLADLFANMSAGGSDLPDTPGTDGTYALQNTVSSGTGTLSWASGGGGGSLVVNVTFPHDIRTCDKTAAEIWAAAQSGHVAFLYEGSGTYYIDPLVQAIKWSGGSYTFYYGYGEYPNHVGANSGADYPTYNPDA